MRCKEKYIGILYGSFIATVDGVYVIEFNARFGDPEALNVLTILESDFVTICQALVKEIYHLSKCNFLNKQRFVNMLFRKVILISPLKM